MAKDSVLSRSEVLQALKLEYDHLNNMGWKKDAQILMDYGIQTVGHLKPVNNYGKWHKAGFMLIQCSKCGRSIGAPIYSAPNYCEHCGAKMRTTEGPADMDYNDYDDLLEK